jgi:hypothetical protein
MNSASPSSIDNEKEKSFALICEITTSSGPRKGMPSERSSNLELGEDSGGVLSLASQLGIIWIADGTSDSTRIGSFSSRILAQDLGQVFSTEILTHWTRLQKFKEPDINLSEIVEETVNKTKLKWSSRLKENPEEEKALVRSLSSLKQKVPEPGAIFYEFSSTFSAVALDREGNLNCVAAGDSLTAIFKKEENQFFAFKKGGVTFRLKVKGGKIICEKFLSPLENYQTGETNFVILSSDGAKETILALAKDKKPLKPDLEHFLLLKQKSIGTYPKTQDDKTLGLIGRIHAS